MCHILDWSHHDRLLGSVPWVILLSIGNKNYIRYTYNKWFWTQIYFTRMEILSIFISTFQVTNSNQESVYCVFLLRNCYYVMQNSYDTDWYEHV